MSSILFGLLLLCCCFISSEAYDSLDPNGNITIKWDIMQWTPDGYVVRMLTIYSSLLPLFSTWWKSHYVMRNKIRNFHTSISHLLSILLLLSNYLKKLFYVLLNSHSISTVVNCQAVVTIFNFQQYRHIQAPGWTLGWTWAKKEVIWSIVGAQTTEQGDCSRYKGNIPHCCKKDPSVVDLLPGTPYNQQIANCCKGGVISSWVQDPPNAASAFQISLGAAGASKRAVRVPKNFTLKAPGPGYTCGAAKVGRPSKFISPDRRRTTQALMTWNITCTYSQFLSQKTPTCCVSLSSFYNDTIVPCPTCSCACQNNISQPGSCVERDSPYLASAISAVGRNSYSPLVQCTNHMCPIRVHWHVKLNYKEYWRVKVTITNFNYRMNYTQWNLVIQHPNFENVTQIFSFYFKSLNPYKDINDTAMLWGIKYYNDLLMHAGPAGNVQSELLFRKDTSTFTFEKGWAFPRRIYFNGDNCVMPPPDAYPWLPNSGLRMKTVTILQLALSMASMSFLLTCV